jgi:hypothetical protein
VATSVTVVDPAAAELSMLTAEAAAPQEQAA